MRNLGYNKGICPECLAGYLDYPFEDNRRLPSWEGTMGVVNPWSEGQESPLLQIPFRPTAPHLFWRKDPFHIWKQSLGGHWIASSIILLLDFKVFGQSSVEEGLELAYQDYNFFVKKEFAGKHVSHLKHFTRQILHFSKQESFPHSRPKGSDVMLITRWLSALLARGPYDPEKGGRSGRSLVSHPPQPHHAEFFRAMASGNNAALQFFRQTHTNGIWLLRSVAQDMCSAAFSFTDAYACLAKLCHQQKLARFHLEPSYHYWHHFGVEYRQRLENGDTYIYSCACDCCEADEDFVGKIAKISKAVHASTVSLRVLERYLLMCRAVFSDDDLLTITS